MTRLELISMLIEKYGEDAELPAVYAELFTLKEIGNMLAGLPQETQTKETEQTHDSQNIIS